MPFAFEDVLHLNVYKDREPIRKIQLLVPEDPSVLPRREEKKFTTIGHKEAFKSSLKDLFLLALKKQSWLEFYDLAFLTDDRDAIEKVLLIDLGRQGTCTWTPPPGPFAGIRSENVGVINLAIALAKTLGEGHADIIREAFQDAAASSEKPVAIAIDFFECFIDQQYLELLLEKDLSSSLKHLKTVLFTKEALAFVQDIGKENLYFVVSDKNRQTLFEKIVRDCALEGSIDPTHIFTTNCYSLQKTLEDFVTRKNQSVFYIGECEDVISDRRLGGKTYWFSADKSFRMKYNINNLPLFLAMHVLKKGTPWDVSKSYLAHSLLEAKKDIEKKRRRHSIYEVLAVDAALLKKAGAKTFLQQQHSKGKSLYIVDPKHIAKITNLPKAMEEIQKMAKKAQKEAFEKATARGENQTDATVLAQKAFCGRMKNVESEARAALAKADAEELRKKFVWEEALTEIPFQIATLSHSFVSDNKNTVYLKSTGSSTFQLFDSGKGVLEIKLPHDTFSDELPTYLETKFTENLVNSIQESLQLTGGHADEKPVAIVVDFFEKKLEDASSALRQAAEKKGAKDPDAEWLRFTTAVIVTEAAKEKEKEKETKMTAEAAETETKTTVEADKSKTKPTVKPSETKAPETAKTTKAGPTKIQPMVLRSSLHASSSVQATIADLINGRPTSLFSNGKKTSLHRNRRSGRNGRKSPKGRSLSRSAALYFY